MIFLTVEEIINLHKKLIQTTGGIDGLRDRGLLESAIYGVFSSYDDIERYKSIEEKAARYALDYNLILDILIHLKIVLMDIGHFQKDLQIHFMKN
jgi:hypothetical protein